MREACGKLRRLCNLAKVKGGVVPVRGKAGDPNDVAEGPCAPGLEVVTFCLGGGRPLKKLEHGKIGM